MQIRAFVSAANNLADSRIYFTNVVSLIRQYAHRPNKKEYPSKYNFTVKHWNKINVVVRGND